MLQKENLGVTNFLQEEWDTNKDLQLQVSWSKHAIRNIALMKDEHNHKSQGFTILYENQWEGTIESVLINDEIISTTNGYNNLDSTIISKKSRLS